MAQPDVLVIGDANPDLVLSGDVVPRFGQQEQLADTADLVLGGSAAIVACGLARLGVGVALAGVVGDDLFGRFVLDELTAAGVDVRWTRIHPGVATGLSVVLSAGDRAILTHAGTIAATGPELVEPALLASVRHVHSASFFLTPRLAPHLPGMFATARAAGATTSLDTNWDPAGTWLGVDAVLEHTTVLMPNASELLAMTGFDDGGDVDAAARRVVGKGAAVALKNGASGGVLWALGEEAVSVPASPTDVVDTTGAGDSFDAGFISGMLDGLPGAECLQRAVRCGSLSTRGFGGTAGQPDRAALG